MMKQWWWVVAGMLRAVAIDNGVGLKPPMGWRSWNLYRLNVNQSLMESIMDGMVSRTREVDGVPTSLADLGYRDVGLDDNWQLCGSYGPENYTYHSSGGIYPIVNREVFPDFEAMTRYAHDLNLTAGWYLNNCHCKDHCGDHSDFNETDDSCYRGDAAALLSYGFDGVKLDGCSGQRDLQLWADLLNASVKPITIENCHWGGTVPTQDWCPFNFYRSSQDVRPEYASILANLETVYKFVNLSYPGCWAYPDMLEVGVPGLTSSEERTHFAAWAIVSSPLTLSMDVTDDAVMDAVWSLVANPEIIAVNQAWAGSPGTRFQAAQYFVDDDLPRVSPTRHFPSYRAFDVPAWQYLYKPVSVSSTAVLMLNSENTSSLLVLDFADVPNSPCSDVCFVRDLFNRTDLGSFSFNYSTTIQSHDAAFILLSSSPSHVTTTTSSSSSSSSKSSPWWKTTLA